MTIPHMTIPHLIIPALWLVFLAYWAVSAIGVKRNLARTSWWKQAALRLFVVVLLIIALSIPEVRREVRLARMHVSGTLTDAIGTVLVALGVGLAIFARAWLGRNWGTPMSRKEDPELIVGGPYAVIRHPIYTGIMLAILGSAIAQSMLWLLPLVLSGAYFGYSARREEALMAAQFPGEYRAYRARTAMFIPFVL